MNYIKKIAHFLALFSWQFLDLSCTQSPTFNTDYLSSTNSNLVVYHLVRQSNVDIQNFPKEMEKSITLFCNGELKGRTFKDPKIPITNKIKKGGVGECSSSKRDYL